MHKSRKLLLAACVALSLCGCSRVEPVEEIRASPDATSSDAVAQVSVDLERDWPWWRGPGGDGTSDDVDLPTSWSAEKNIQWSAAVPGRGHSSPTIVGQQIFLTTADDDAERQMLLCYDRQSGSPLWTTLVHEGNFMKLHRKNSQASATPACDGQRVFALFLNNGGLWATATDLDGQILWQTEAGPFGAEHGYGASPAIYKSLLIVQGDNLTGSFIAALNRQTGEIVWRTARETTGRHGSYATPIVANLAGRDQLLVLGMSGTASYDPDSGELLWSCQGPSEVAANTVATGEGLVFASGGYPEKELLAIRPDGAGDVSDSHVVWRARKGVAYVPSPVYSAGRLFVISDDGVATCIDAATGRALKTRRIGGNYSASPILADGHLYVTDESGSTVVLRADDTLEVVSRNTLGDGGFATIAISDSHIYLRTTERLYAIVAPAE